jgi:hypothetical protein
MKQESDRGMRFTIGTEMKCVDGKCGSSSRVVLDPSSWAVTHLVVEPRRRTGLGRFVPIDLLEASHGEIRVRCTLADFDRLDHAEVTIFLPASGGRAEYTAGQPLAVPFMGLADIIGNVPQAVTLDRTPAGGMELWGGEPVHASDGSVGRVEGVIAAPANRLVTHVLVAGGHPWKHKHAVVPIDRITGIDRSVHLRGTKQEASGPPPISPSAEPAS